MTAASPPLSTRDPVVQSAIVAGLLACAGGFMAHRLWTQVPLGRAAELAAIAGLAALIAWGLVRWRRMHWASAAAIVWLAALVVHAGAAPVLATAALGAGILAVGTLFTRNPDPAFAFVTGTAVFTGLIGWLLPLQIHYAFVHLPLLVGLVFWRRKAMHAQFDALRAGWTAAVGADPRAALWGVMALGLASSGAWLPTVQYDDLAYHLGLPWQLSQHGRYLLDPTHQVAALSPWASDVLHAIAQLLAGVEARGALNAAWLAATALLLWRLAARIGVDVRGRWLVLVLLGTLPLLPALVAGMHTELPATAATLAIALLVGRDAPAGRHSVYALAALGGFLLALKLTHPLAAIGLLLAGLWTHRDALRARPLDLAGSAALTLAVAGSSYAYSWWITGNPVLPFFNATFRSPYFPPTDLHDMRWTGDGALTVWKMVFDTSRYLEGWDGGFGFVPVALGGAVLVALRKRRTRLLTACAVLALCLPLIAVPYARYAFVGLVLLVPVAVHALMASFAARTATAMLLSVALLDALFVPNAHWLLHTGAAKRALLTGGRDAPLLARYAPERLVHARIRREFPGAVVLDLHGATHAELAGWGRTTTWYAPRMHRAAAAADLDASGGRWASLLASEDVTHVLLRRERLTPASARGLARLGAYRTLTIDHVQWWRIPPRNTP